MQIEQNRRGIAGMAFGLSSVCGLLGRRRRKTGELIWTTRVGTDRWEIDQINAISNTTWQVSGLGNGYSLARGKSAVGGVTTPHSAPTFQPAEVIRHTPFGLCLG